MSDISVSLNVICSSEAEAIKALETLSRPAAGLAFDGIYASLTIHQIDEESE